MKQCALRQVGRRRFVSHEPRVCPNGHRVLWCESTDWRCENAPECKETWTDRPGSGGLWAEMYAPPPTGSGPGARPGEETEK